MSGKRVGRNEWYYAVLVILTLIAGLRWRVGTDTIAYLARFYHDYPTLGNLSFKDYGFGKDPLYALINVVVKTLGGRFYMVQIIQATIVNTLIFQYIKRHSKYIFTCVLFYYIMCYLNFNMETMRASISIVICLFGNDYIMEKKWVKGYLLYVLACLFHYQTLVILLLPSLYWIRFNKYGIMLFVAAFVTGFFLKGIVENFLFLFDENDFLQEKVEDKIYSDRWGNQRGNFLYYVGLVLIKIAYPLTALYIVKRYRKNRIISLYAIWKEKRHHIPALFLVKRYKEYQDVMRLEPFIILGVLFALVQMNISIAFRYVYYFEIYFAIIYAEVFIKIIPKILHNNRQYIYSVLIFIPLLLYYVNPKYQSHFYHPYTSVIEMSIDKDKEKAMQYKSAYSTPNTHEY
jgi:hypothetical protein